ncbi:hypothetical protein [Streptomyces nojiriensis]|uniref:hypothetical protein n=1 Tax=Streptomyces nojiriensis TaxID=66374 RepID=UPI00364B71F3
MRGNTTRALVALVLAAGIGWGGATASAAGDGPAGHRVRADAELPGWLDPGKDCIVTTAWGDATCPAREY